MVFHTIVIDVGSNTCTCSGREVIEIPQGDKNTHQILIRLTQNGKFYNISEDSSAEISFYNSLDDEIFTTTSVKIANYYRGYVTYIVGPRLVRDPGRFVGRLTLFNSCGCKNLSVRFIVNVTKSFPDNNGGCGCGGSTEVVISREFYQELQNHLKDSEIHLTDRDVELLEFVSDNQLTFITYDNLGQALKEDPDIRKALSETVSELVKESVEEIGDLSEIKGRVDDIEEALVWETL